MNGPSKALGMRLPEDLLQEIEWVAQVTDRSINRVVVRMLQKQIKQEKKSDESQAKKG